MTEKEPGWLSRGRAFHKKMQADWKKNAQGDIESEKTITEFSGRGGI